MPRSKWIVRGEQQSDKVKNTQSESQVRTCWVEMPPLRDIGAALQHRYRQSKRVRVNAKGNLQLVAPINRHYQPVKKKNFDTDIDEQDSSTEIGNETETNTFYIVLFRRSRRGKCAHAPLRPAVQIWIPSASQRRSRPAWECASPR